jgi:hypothetical protein
MLKIHVFEANTNHADYSSNRTMLAYQDVYNLAELRLVFTCGFESKNNMNGTSNNRPS